MSSGASVFMFHRVLPPGQECYDREMVTSTVNFAKFLDWACEHYHILPLDEVVARRGTPEHPRRPLSAITFDDGWSDNYLHALPMIRERKLSATIFLPVRFIGTMRRFWQEQLWYCMTRLEQDGRQKEIVQEVSRRFPWFPPSLPTTNLTTWIRRLLMTRMSEEAEEFVQSLRESTGQLDGSKERTFLNWDEVHQMQDSGISFGSHTLNHSLLTHLAPAKALLEIERSATEMHERLGKPQCGFSYPWGAAGPSARSAAKESYLYAVTTHAGLVQARSDPWMLPRIPVSDMVLTHNDQFSPGKAQLWFARRLFSQWVSSAVRSHPRKNSDRVKIMFVIDQITEWEGGTERQLNILIRALDRDFFDPELCFIFPTTALPKDSLPCAAQWLCQDQQVPSFIPRLLRLVRALRQSRPDIVQTFFIEGIFSGIIAAHVARVPKIIGSTRNAGHWKKKRHRIAFRSVSRLAHHWQCNSRATYDYTARVERVPRDRIEIIPNAIDLSYFTPASSAERLAARKSLGLGTESPVFVSVANLTPVKDIPTLLRAARLLHARFPNAQYLLVGEGPLHPELQREADKLGLEGVIRFVGCQPDVRPYLAAADYGVLTSHSEGSSNSVIEYMAMGLPSAVSDIEPNRELVQGLLFPAGDAIKLSEKLAQLVVDKEICDQLRKQYAQVVAQFSQERFGSRIQCYYNKLFAEIHQNSGH
jgi:glycosyltransferase involved in cell wall biosynthesis/peptidoglycan/xylan/chitin deacetylase (PgdA/CDA1 family)